MSTPEICPFWGPNFLAPAARKFLELPLVEAILARPRREKMVVFIGFPLLETVFFFGRASGAVGALNTLDKSNFSPPQARKNRIYGDFPLENSVFLASLRFVFDAFLKEIALLQCKIHQVQTIMPSL